MEVMVMAGVVARAVQPPPQTFSHIRKAIVFAFHSDPDIYTSIGRFVLRLFVCLFFYYLFEAAQRQQSHVIFK